MSSSTSIADLDVGYISEGLLINRYDPDADLFDYGAVFLGQAGSSMRAATAFTPDLSPLRSTTDDVAELIGLSPV
jgi:hypothetical protein